MRKAIVIPLLTVVALGAAAVIAAPAYIQHRVIEEAAARGIVLSIHDTHIGLDGIHLQVVAATTARVPNARLRANEVFATWDASQVRVSGGELTIDGPITPPTGAAAEEKPVPAAGPTSLHVESTHISWTHLAGNVSIDVADVTGDFALAPQLGDTFDVQGATSMTAAGFTIGPFQSRLSRDLTGEHARMALDPSDTMANVLSFDRSGDTMRTEWVVKKRATSKLGIPLTVLGVQLDTDPTIDLHLVDSVTRPANAISTGSGSLSLASDAVMLPQQKAPMPASIDLSWKGNADAKMPVDQGKFHAGPFDGTITGTVSRPLGGALVDLAVQSNSVPCEQFASGDVSSLVNNALGGLGGSIGGTVAGALANVGGVKSKMLGSVKISGNIRFDSQNPSARQVAIVPANDCHVELSAGQP